MMTCHSLDLVGFSASPTQNEKEKKKKRQSFLSGQVSEEGKAGDQKGELIRPQRRAYHLSLLKTGKVEDWVRMCCVALCVLLTKV
jgi:hypothetical protein